MNQLPAVSQKCLRCPGEHSTERETALQRAAHVRGTPSSSLSQLEETSAEKLQRQHFLWSPKAFFSICYKNSFENLFSGAGGRPRALPSTSGCCRQTDGRMDRHWITAQPAHSSAPALLFQLPALPNFESSQSWSLPSSLHPQSCTGWLSLLTRRWV